jgi:hypothetical protein
MDKDGGEGDGGGDVGDGDNGEQAEAYENINIAGHSWPTGFSAVEVMICDMQLLRWRWRSWIVISFLGILVGFRLAHWNHKRYFDIMIYDVGLLKKQPDIRLVPNAFVVPFS